MSLINRLLGQTPKDPSDPKTHEDEWVEKIAGDINKHFEEWIESELGRIIKPDEVAKLKDLDFNTVLKVQSLNLFLKNGVTMNYKQKGATFTIKLCNGNPNGKFKVMSKFKYNMHLQDPEEEEECEA